MCTPPFPMPEQVVPNGAKNMRKSRKADHEQTCDKTTRRSANQIKTLVTKHPLSLQRYLCSLETDKCMDLVPVDIRRLVITQWKDKVQQFWSAQRCCLLKATICLSNENWIWLRQLLGRTFNTNGELVDHTIDGVKLPLLRGKWTIIQNTHTIARLARAQSSHGGLAATRDALVLVQQMLRKVARRPQHILKWSCDAAPAGKIGFTQVCLTIDPDEQDMSGSPLHTKVVALFHGKEDAKSVWHFAKPVMDQVQTMFDSGQVCVPIDDTTEDIKCKIKPVLGGDEKMKSAAHMHMGFKSCGSLT